MSDTRKAKVKVRNLAVMKAALEKAGMVTAEKASYTDYYGAKHNTPLAFKLGTAPASDPNRFGFVAQKDGSYNLEGDFHYVAYGSGFTWDKAAAGKKVKQPWDQFVDRVTSLYNMEAMLTYANNSPAIQVTSHTPHNTVYKTAKVSVEVETYA